MLPLFAVIAVILSPTASAAGGSVAEDRCQQHCVFERDETGRAYVSCHCGKRGGGIKPGALASPLASLRAFPAGSAPRAGEEIALCESAVAHAPSSFTGPREIVGMASRQTLPLCECVAARTHLPVSRRCEIRPTGETACDFAPDFSRPSVGRALRRATLEDYQSCLMAANNYERPSTCAEVSRCQAAKPACASGQELVNVADPEACCPVFVCRKENA